MDIEEGKAILDKVLTAGDEMAHKKCSAVEVELAKHLRLAQEEEDHQQKQSTQLCLQVVSHSQDEEADNLELKPRITN
jgi:hypothetical protein